MDNNEKTYINKLLNNNKAIRESQKYIEEEYHVKSRYDNDESSLYIWSDYNQSEDTILAKKYLCEKLDTNFINIIYGK